MKIAFTTTGNDLSGAMDERFGRAARFLIFDTEKKTFHITDNTSISAAQGAGIKSAETIARTGASVVVTGACGPKAFNALRQAGIKIYSQKGGTVQNALDLFLAGRLEEIAAA